MSACKISDWSSPQVSKWLNDHALGHIDPLFVANDIKGDMLLGLTQEDIEDRFGVHSQRDRAALWELIGYLRKRSQCESTKAAICLQCEDIIDLNRQMQITEDADETKSEEPGGSLDLALELFRNELMQAWAEANDVQTALNLQDHLALDGVRVQNDTNLANNLERDFRLISLQEAADHRCAQRLAGVGPSRGLRPASSDAGIGADRARARAGAGAGACAGASSEDVLPCAPSEVLWHRP
jgi:hypothetical protein